MKSKNTNRKENNNDKNNDLNNSIYYKNLTNIKRKIQDIKNKKTYSNKKNNLSLNPIDFKLNENKLNDDFLTISANSILDSKLDKTLKNTDLNRSGFFTYASDASPLIAAKDEGTNKNIRFNISLSGISAITFENHVNSPFIATDDTHVITLYKLNSDLDPIKDGTFSFPELTLNGETIDTWPSGSGASSASQIKDDSETNPTNGINPWKTQIDTNTDDIAGIMDGTTPINSVSSSTEDDSISNPDSGINLWKTQIDTNTDDIAGIIDGTTPINSVSSSTEDDSISNPDSGINPWKTQIVTNASDIAGIIDGTTPIDVFSSTATDDSEINPDSGINPWKTQIDTNASDITGIIDGTIPTNSVSSSTEDDSISNPTFGINPWKTQIDTNTTDIEDIKSGDFSYPKLILNGEEIDSWPTEGDTSSTSDITDNSETNPDDGINPWKTQIDTNASNIAEIMNGTIPTNSVSSSTEDDSISNPTFGINPWKTQIDTNTVGIENLNTEINDIINGNIDFNFITSDIAAVNSTLEGGANQQLINQINKTNISKNAQNISNNTSKITDIISGDIVISTSSFSSTVIDDSTLYEDEGINPWKKSLDSIESGEYNFPKITLNGETIDVWPSGGSGGAASTSDITAVSSTLEGGNTQQIINEANKINIDKNASDIEDVLSGDLSFTGITLNGETIDVWPSGGSGDAASTSDIVAVSSILEGGENQQIINEANKENITTNASNIATNTSNIATNTSNISNITSGNISFTEITLNGETIDTWPSGGDGSAASTSDITAVSSTLEGGNTQQIINEANKINIDKNASDIEDVLSGDLSFTGITLNGETIDVWPSGGSGGAASTSDITAVSSTLEGGNNQQIINEANKINIDKNASDIEDVLSGDLSFTGITLNGETIDTWPSGGSGEVASTTDLLAADSTLEGGENQQLINEANKESIATNTSNIATNSANISSITSGNISFTEITLNGETINTWPSGDGAASTTDLLATDSTLEGGENQQLINEANKESIATNTSNIAANASDISSITSGDFVFTEINLNGETIDTWPSGGSGSYSTSDITAVSSTSEGGANQQIINEANKVSINKNASDIAEIKNGLNSFPQLILNEKLISSWPTAFSTSDIIPVSSALEGGGNQQIINLLNKENIESNTSDLEDIRTGELSFTGINLNGETIDSWPSGDGASLTSDLLAVDSALEGGENQQSINEANKEAIETNASNISDIMDGTIPTNSVSSSTEDDSISNPTFGINPWKTQIDENTSGVASNASDIADILSGTSDFAQITLNGETIDTWPSGDGASLTSDLLAADSTLEGGENQQLINEANKEALETNTSNISDIMNGIIPINSLSSSITDNSSSNPNEGINPWKVQIAENASGIANILSGASTFTGITLNGETIDTWPSGDGASLTSDLLAVDSALEGGTNQQIINEANKEAIETNSSDILENASDIADILSGNSEFTQITLNGETIDTWPSGGSGGAASTSDITAVSSTLEGGNTQQIINEANKINIDKNASDIEDVLSGDLSFTGITLNGETIDTWPSGGSGGISSTSDLLASDSTLEGGANQQLINEANKEAIETNSSAISENASDIADIIDGTIPVNSLSSTTTDDSSSKPAEGINPWKTQIDENTSGVASNSSNIASITSGDFVFTEINLNGETINTWPSGDGASASSNITDDSNTNPTEGINPWKKQIDTNTDDIADILSGTSDFTQITLNGETINTWPSGDGASLTSNLLAADSSLEGGTNQQIINEVNKENISKNTSDIVINASNIVDNASDITNIKNGLINYPRLLLNGDLITSWPSSESITPLTSAILAVDSSLEGGANQQIINEANKEKIATNASNISTNSSNILNIINGTTLINSFSSSVKDDSSSNSNQGINPWKKLIDENASDIAGNSSDIEDIKSGDISYPKLILNGSEIDSWPSEIDASTADIISVSSTLEGGANQQIINEANKLNIEKNASDIADIIDGTTPVNSFSSLTSDDSSVKPIQGINPWKTQIDKNKSDIADNAADIADNASDIADIIDGTIPINISSSVTVDDSYLKPTQGINPWKTQIDKNKSDIAANTSDIADNAADIADNASDIADIIDGTIPIDVVSSATSDDSSTNPTRGINPWKKQIDTNTGNIEDNASDIADIIDGTTPINIYSSATSDDSFSKPTQGINPWKTQIDKNKSDIADNASDIADNAADIADIIDGTIPIDVVSSATSDDSSTNPTRGINPWKKQIDTNTDDIADNTSNISDNTSDISNIKDGDINFPKLTLGGDTIYSWPSGEEDSISSNITDDSSSNSTQGINPWKKQIDTNKSDIADNTSDIINNASNISDNTSDIGDIKDGDINFPKLTLGGDTIYSWPSGEGSSASSDITDDSSSNPNVGINPWKKQIDTNKSDIVGNTSDISDIKDGDINFPKLTLGGDTIYSWPSGEGASASSDITDDSSSNPNVGINPWKKQIDTNTSDISDNTSDIVNNTSDISDIKDGEIDFPKLTLGGDTIYSWPSGEGASASSDITDDSSSNSTQGINPWKKQIDTNTSDISDNTSDIVNNTSDISDIKNGEINFPQLTLGGDTIESWPSGEGSSASSDITDDSSSNSTQGINPWKKQIDTNTSDISDNTSDIVDIKDGDINFPKLTLGGDTIYSWPSGEGASASSDITDDSSSNPNVGINPWKKQIDTNTSDISDNTSDISNNTSDIVNNTSDIVDIKDGEIDFPKLTLGGDTIYSWPSGEGASASSDITDDSSSNPNEGINPWKKQIDTNTDDIADNTSDIAGIIDGTIPIDVLSSTTLDDSNTNPTDGINPWKTQIDTNTDDIAGMLSGDLSFDGITLNGTTIDTWPSGDGASASSGIADDSETNPTEGINPWKTQIDTNTDDIVDNTSDIAGIIDGTIPIDVLSSTTLDDSPSNPTEGINPWKTQIDTNTDDIAGMLSGDLSFDGITLNGTTIDTWPSGDGASISSGITDDSETNPTEGINPWKTQIDTNTDDIAGMLSGDLSFDGITLNGTTIDTWPSGDGASASSGITDDSETNPTEGINPWKTQIDTNTDDIADNTSDIAGIIDGTIPIDVLSSTTLDDSSSNPTEGINPWKTQIDTNTDDIAGMLSGDLSFDGITLNGTTIDTWPSGDGASASSGITDDSETNPTEGINPWKTQIDTNTDDIAGMLSGDLSFDGITLNGTTIDTWPSGDGASASSGITDDSETNPTEGINPKLLGIDNKLDESFLDEDLNQEGRFGYTENGSPFVRKTDLNTDEDSELRILTDSINLIHSNGDVLLPISDSSATPKLYVDNLIDEVNANVDQNASDIAGMLSGDLSFDGITLNGTTIDTWPSGDGASASSGITDDSETNPTEGINPWKTQIDTNTDDIAGMLSGDLSFDGITLNGTTIDTWPSGDGASASSGITDDSETNPTEGINPKLLGIDNKLDESFLDEDLNQEGRFGYTENGSPFIRKTDLNTDEDSELRILTDSINLIHSNGDVLLPISDSSATPKLYVDNLIDEVNANVDQNASDIAGMLSGDLSFDGITLNGTTIDTWPSGDGASASSGITDDSETNPNEGINPWKTQIDANTDDIADIVSGEILINSNSSVTKDDSAFNPLLGINPWKTLIDLNTEDIADMLSGVSSFTEITLNGETIDTWPSGDGASASSGITDDSDTNPTEGINPKLLGIDNKLDESFLDEDLNQEGRFGYTENGSPFIRKTDLNTDEDSELRILTDSINLIHSNGDVLLPISDSSATPKLYVDNLIDEVNANVDQNASDIAGMLSGDLSFDGITLNGTTIDTWPSGDGASISSGITDDSETNPTEGINPWKTQIDTNTDDISGIIDGTTPINVYSSGTIDDSEENPIRGINPWKIEINRNADDIAGIIDGTTPINSFSSSITDDSETNPTEGINPKLLGIDNKLDESFLDEDLNQEGRFGYTENGSPFIRKTDLNTDEDSELRILTDSINLIHSNGDVLLPISDSSATPKLYVDNLIDEVNANVDQNASDIAGMLSGDLSFTGITLNGETIDTWPSGEGDSVSSGIIDDSETNPDDGINPWKTLIDENASAIAENILSISYNTSDIADIISGEIPINSNSSVTKDDSAVNPLLGINPWKTLIDLNTEDIADMLSGASSFTEITLNGETIDTWPSGEGASSSSGITDDSEIEGNEILGINPWKTLINENASAIAINTSNIVDILSGVSDFTEITLNGETIDTWPSGIEASSGLTDDSEIEGNETLGINPWKILIDENASAIAINTSNIADILSGASSFTEITLNGETINTWPSGIEASSELIDDSETEGNETLGINSWKTLIDENASAIAINTSNISDILSGASSFTEITLNGETINTWPSGIEASSELTDDSETEGNEVLGINPWKTQIDTNTVDIADILSGASSFTKITLNGETIDAWSSGAGASSELIDDSETEGNEVLGINPWKTLIDENAAAIAENVLGISYNTSDIADIIDGTIPINSNSSVTKDDSVVNPLLGINPWKTQIDLNTEDIAAIKSGSVSYSQITLDDTTISSWSEAGISSSSELIDDSETEGNETLGINSWKTLIDENASLISTNILNISYNTSDIADIIDGTIQINSNSSVTKDDSVVNPLLGINPWKTQIDLNTLDIDDLKNTFLNFKETSLNDNLIKIQKNRNLIGLKANQLDLNKTIINVKNNTSNIKDIIEGKTKINTFTSNISSINEIKEGGKTQGIINENVQEQINNLNEIIKQLYLPIDSIIVSSKSPQYGTWINLGKLLENEAFAFECRNKKSEFYIWKREA